MIQPTLKDRLKDPHVIRVYRNMIQNGDEQVAKELRDNLIKHADGHPKQVELEQLYQERFAK